MSRRDDLIREAFGEATSPGRKWTPDEASEIERLRQAVSGLKALRETPEPQLSVERLRDAVLKTEMRQRDGGFRWSMVAAPVGLGVALIAFLALRPDAGRPVAYIADDAPRARPSSTIELPAPAVTPKSGPQAVVPAPNQGPPASVAARASQRRPSPRVTNVSDVVRVASGVTASRSGSAVADAGALVANHTVMGPEPPIENLAPAAVPDDTVVVIESRPDASTGSRSASEVEASSDVVIGG